MSFTCIAIVFTQLNGWLVVWVYGISTFVGYLMPNEFLYIFMKIVLFQTIQFSINTQFKCKYSLIVKKHFCFRLFSLVKLF